MTLSALGEQRDEKRRQVNRARAGGGLPSTIAAVSIRRLRTGANASSGPMVPITRCAAACDTRTTLRSGAWSGASASTSRPAAPGQPAAMPTADLADRL
jgi:hypothetical protein